MSVLPYLLGWGSSHNISMSNRRHRSHLRGRWCAKTALQEEHTGLEYYCNSSLEHTHLPHIPVYHASACLCAWNIHNQKSILCWSSVPSAGVINFKISFMLHFTVCNSSFTVFTEIPQWWEFFSHQSTDESLIAQLVKQSACNAEDLVSFPVSGKIQLKG